MQSTLKKPWSPGKSQGSGNIGSKLLEFVVGSNFIVTLTHSLAHSEGQRSSLRLRGSKLQKTSESSKCNECLSKLFVPVYFSLTKNFFFTPSKYGKTHVDGLESYEERAITARDSCRT